MKKCPACAEEIQDTAVKCKHCGKSLKRSNWIWWALGILVVLALFYSKSNNTTSVNTTSENTTLENTNNVIPQNTNNQEDLTSMSISQHLAVGNFLMPLGFVPEHNILYSLNFIEVLQSTTDGVLIEMNPTMAAEGGSTSEVAFLYTDDQFVDGADLTGRYAYYVGIYTYSTVLGVEKNIYSFKLVEPNDIAKIVARIREGDEQDIVRITPTVVTRPETITSDSFIINVPNSQGGYTAIVIQKSGNGYTGPQGKHFSDFPTVAQLQSTYGLGSSNSMTK